MLADGRVGIVGKGLNGGDAVVVLVVVADRGAAVVLAGAVADTDFDVLTCGTDGVTFVLVEGETTVVLGATGGGPVLINVCFGGALN
jgi:uncharacterized membrane protein